MAVVPNDFFLMHMWHKWQKDRKEKGIQPFSYYRTRADDEGLEKMGYFSLHALKYGAGAGIIDGIAITEVSTFAQYLGRIGYWTVPLVGSFGAFVATNHFLAKFTGKDTWQNHGVSGIAAAAVWGAKFQSAKVGLWGSLALCVWCSIKKWSVDNNFKLGGKPKGREYIFLAQQYDMTVIKSP
uniref:NADH dehydrogenase [ubiquinone] 1 alpha subcomplex subunit 11 n=1 Tax=Amblyomma cajennense TaxID=34607 RepID=A0A023FRK7_AMBCJ